MKFTWLPWRRKPPVVAEQEEALSRRLAEVEEGRRQVVHPEIDAVKQRLRFLELQAEVIARKKLKFDHNGER